MIIDFDENLTGTAVIISYKLSIIYEHIQQKYEAMCRFEYFELIITNF